MSRSTRTRMQENLCPRRRKLAERYTISVTNGREAPELGSPRRRCPHCGYIYYDGHFREAALLEYDARAFCPSLALWSAMLALAILMLVWDGTLLAAPTGIDALPGAMALGSAALVVWSVHVRRHRETADARCREKSERRLDAYRGEDALGVSLRRMAEADYLYFLLAHGETVPDYFFRRIGAVRDEARVQSERERWAGEARQFAERLDRENERLAAENEAEYWEYFLTLDPDGALFERHARSHGMCPAHFRDHCRAMAAKGDRVK